MLRAILLDATTSYVSVAAAIAGQTGKPAADLQGLKDGAYKNIGTVNLRISIFSPNQSASDLVSFLLAPGESESFDETDFNFAAFKSIGADSAVSLQITGSEG